MASKKWFIRKERTYGPSRPEHIWFHAAPLFLV